MKRRRWPWVLLALLVVGSLGAWLADRTLKGHNHPGLVTFARQWWSNYPKSFAITPPEISIKVDQAGMDRLEGVVERSREAGVIVQEGNEYVSGEFHVEMPGGGEGTGDFKGRLRIKGKMTDHVEGEKWSFRVVAKKSGGFLGMKRFSLQHPGTRNYLCDWLYHQLMKGEGLIALRYGFCKVKLNDEPLGVYAYEEHFGPELLENNERVPGPIVRFEPGLFWLHRMQGTDGRIRVNDAYGAYQAANLDAFDTNEIAADPEMKQHYERALKLVERFRRGELKASQIFDVERTGKRLAMLDLVGGQHSMDWSDVKFYFDPIAQRLEPISYESFSAYPIQELAGAYKASGSFRESDDLHTAFFKDPEILAAYVRHLERYSQKVWLDSAFMALRSALDTASATLYGEFPYKELDRSVYYANQRTIATLLNVPKGFHAYNNGLRNDTLTLALVPVESLPMQVDSLVLANGDRVAPAQQTILPARPRGRTGAPVEVAFAAKSDSAVKVIYHVPGSSVRKELDVFPFKLSVSAGQDELLAGMEPNPQEFPFLHVDEASKTITIQEGGWQIDRTMILPAGYRCVARGSLYLDIRNGAEIISYSSLDWMGDEEDQIIVYSADSSSHGVHVIGAQGTSSLAHVSFAQLTRYKYDQERSGDVSFHGTHVHLEDCSFRGTGSTLLDLSMSEGTLIDLDFSGGSDQLELHFANMQIRTSRFTGAKDDAISVEGGRLFLYSCEIGHAGGIAVKGSKSAWIEMSDGIIRDCSTAFEGREGSRLLVKRGLVEKVEQLAEAKKKEMRYGPVRIELMEVKGVTPEAPVKCAEGSVITIDGKKAGQVKSDSGT